MSRKFITKYSGLILNVEPTDEDICERLGIKKSQYSYVATQLDHFAKGHLKKVHLSAKLLLKIFKKLLITDEKLIGYLEQKIKKISKLILKITRLHLAHLITTWKNEVCY